MEGPTSRRTSSASAAVADGDLVGQPVAGLEPGYRKVSVPAALASGDPACFRHDSSLTAACAVAASRGGSMVVATSAGTAPPWYYALVGAVARVLSEGNGVLAYRMATVLLGAAILGHALARSARYGGSAWLVVALTPSAWFLTGVVGTSGIEIALVALALVEAVARFHQRAGSVSLARVTVPLAVCLLLRPAAIIDIAVVALVVAPTLPRPVTRRTVAALASPFVVVAIASLAWNRWSDFVFSNRSTADSDSLPAALGRSLGDIPTTVHQAIGALGWNEFHAPFLAQAVWVATLAFAAYWAFTHSPRRWWHVYWAVAALLLPTVVEVMVHGRIGPVWQGRYSIAFALGGVLYAGTCAMPPRAVMRRFLIAAVCAEVLTLWHTLRRYMVGLDGSTTLQQPSWTPPLNPWLLLAVNAAAMAWLATMTLRRQGMTYPKTSTM